MTQDHEPGSPEGPREPSGETKTDLDSPTRIPRRIGQYGIKRVIASGGMGTVYEGVQEHPRRPVAIKVMKHGVTSRSAMRRFEYEAQLLARLHHPCIAQVYEAGTHDDGSGAVPFFAMEYIPNAKPITRYAQDKKLGTQERLKLFAKVCDAVHHGHQKGIIHRDLKPSNILVDPHGEPRIIDFGVARATDSDMAVTTLQTDVGQLIGTLQYMSPEQFDADPHDIDTRSDVYALGVVLYNLLCGRLPYDVKQAAVYEVARVVREQAPDRPSTTDATLRGDVETIVLKSLEKDRDRRYQSAFGLGQDIRRYLAGEAVAAQPPSISYQLKVFARRNKTLLGATTAVFVVLLAGVIVSTSLLLRSRTDRARAEQQAKKALAAIDFLEDVVQSADPFNVGREVKITELLDRYGANIDEAFPDQPEVEAAVRTAISRSYSHLDMFEKKGVDQDYHQAARDHLAAALDLRQRTLGEEHPETLDTMNELAQLLQDHGRREEAGRLRRQVLEIRRRRLGEDHPDTLRAMFKLTGLLRDLGRADEAERLMLETLEARKRAFGDEHEDTLASMTQVAWLRLSQGELDEAERLMRRVFDTRLRTVGEAKSEASKADLANTLLAQGKLSEAESLYPGQEMPENPGIEQWFQQPVDLHNGQPTLLAFWEEWCPYSYREIPKLQETYNQYKDRGLQIVALTEVTKNSTDQKIRDFIQEKQLTFPIAKENGEVSEYFAPGKGVPWAAVIRDGRLVWRGHPAKLSKPMLDGLVDRATPR